MALGDVLKKFKILIILVLLAGLSVGGYFGWKHYKFLQSPEHYVEKLNAALNANNKAELATLLDLRKITEELAARFLSAPLPNESVKPQDTGPTQLAETMQLAFIDALLTRDQEPAPAPPKNPLRPIEPFPDDFAKQLVGNITLKSASENSAVAQVNIHYPRTKKDVTFLLQIEKKPDWIMTRVLNIDQLLQIYIEEEKIMDAMRQDAYITKMNENAKRMKAQFIVHSCFAFMQTVSRQDGGILIVRVKGYNKGPHIIRNMTLETVVSATNPQGPFSFKRNLHSATRILPAVDLEDSYTLELDPNNAEDAAILQGHGFSCTATPTTMTLGNGEFLFVHTQQDTNIIQ